MAAFATSNEGHILLGINDRGRVVGLARSFGSSEAEWRDSIQRRIQGIADIVDPKIRVDVAFVTLPEETICDVFVPKGAEPVYTVRNVPYLRDLSTTQRATPEDVKELHRRYFQASPTPPNPNNEKLLELANQLADLSLILSDVQDLHGDDFKQWRYDLESTGQVLRHLATSMEIAGVGAHDELLTLAAQLDDLAAVRSYGVSGTAWDVVLEKSNLARESAGFLIQRLGKRISFDPLEFDRIKKAAALFLRLLRDSWSQREELLRQGRLSTLRSDIRSIAFGFNRFATQLSLGGEMRLRELFSDIARLLRSVDKDLVFRPAVGGNPWNEMESTMEKAIALADTIDKILR